MDLVIVTTTETQRVIVDELYISDSMETTIIKKEKEKTYDKRILCYKTENKFIKVDFKNSTINGINHKPDMNNVYRSNLPFPLKGSLKKDIKTGKQTQNYVEIEFNNIKEIQYI